MPQKQTVLLALHPKCNPVTHSQAWICTSFCIDLISYLILPSYIMENVGINATESAISTGSSSAPVVTLDRYNFENAVSAMAAQSIWLGESTLLSLFHG